MSLKVLTIFLVFLIFVLCILDAPEYIRCNHIGLCEILEIPVLQKNILKKRYYDAYFLCRKKYKFFLENFLVEKELIQHLEVFCIEAESKSFKISCTLTETQNTVLVKTGNPFPLIENHLTAQILKIVDISVIRS